MVFSLGSVADRVYNRVENISTSISGQLVNIAFEQQLYAESYTGQTIGSVNIDDKYLPALVGLTTAQVLDAMQTAGANASSISVGDFTIQKGKGGNLSSAADGIREDALRKLRMLGKTFIHQAVRS